MKGMIVSAGVLVCALLATSARAQTGFKAGSSGEAVVASAVGKNTSVAANDLSVTALPAFPATLTVNSVPVPSKYKSKKLFLLIDTDVQTNCSGAGLATGSVVAVGGILAFPDPTAIFYFECSNNGGFTKIPGHWFMIPETAGGAIVPAGATIDHMMTSTGAGENVGIATLMAEATK